MNVEELIANGFTRRMAEDWLAQVEKERCDGSFDRDEVEFAHANGFLAESVKVWGVTEENKRLYLSDYEYARLWPLNSWRRIWINDKLTLKLILAEGSFSKAMPDYYYYSQEGALVPLMNCPNVNSLASALESLGEMACKHAMDPFAQASTGWLIQQTVLPSTGTLSMQAISNASRPRIRTISLPSSFAQAISFAALVR